MNKLGAGCSFSAPFHRFMNIKSSYQDSDFCFIDDGAKLPIFMLTLLKLGRVLLQEEHSRLEVLDSTACRLMTKHRNELPNVYRLKELRELLDFYQPDFRGGGIKVEWAEMTGEGQRVRRKYYLNFERIYKPEIPGNNENQPSPAI